MHETTYQLYQLIYKRDNVIVNLSFIIFHKQIDKTWYQSKPTYCSKNVLSCWNIGSV